MLALRLVDSDGLTSEDRRALRALMGRAFGAGFTDDDWDHALGGTHVLGELAGALVAHASVVPRRLEVGRRWLAAGFVEAVATDPAHEGSGCGSAVMSVAGELIAARYELGALSTGRHGFYRRLGWEVWTGPTFVITSEGRVHTVDDDGDVLVLRTPATPALAVGAPIACDARRGDPW